jgi:hypothetical protein
MYFKDNSSAGFKGLGSLTTEGGTWHSFKMSGTFNNKASYPRRPEPKALILFPYLR